MAAPQPRSRLVDRKRMQLDSKERRLQRTRRDLETRRGACGTTGDTSYSGRWVRYAPFLLSMSLIMTSVPLAIPAATSPEAPGLLASRLLLPGRRPEVPTRTQRAPGRRHMR
ncbi:uncharacterized protein LOC144128403 [Amblyomma americanum]